MVMSNAPLYHKSVFGLPICTRRTKAESKITIPMLEPGPCPYRMLTQNVRHLPVMAGRQLVGCVSIRELETIEIEAMKVEIQFLDDYIRNIVGW